MTSEPVRDATPDPSTTPGPSNTSISGPDASDPAGALALDPPNPSISPPRAPVLPLTATDFTVLPPPTISPAPPHLATGLAHLTAIAPSLAPLIARHPCPLFDPSIPHPNPFESLSIGIISQQVSTAAARAIKTKFLALFPTTTTFPIPDQVLSTPPATLRTAGLSLRKAEYLHSLATAFTDGSLSPTFLTTATDTDVVEHLTRVRGIGVWSAEMFLIFGLRRPDIFSAGDLGIQRGMAALVGKDVAALKKANRKAGGSGKSGKGKYMKEEEMLRVAERFRPWRSLLCWYLWRIEGADLDAMAKVGAGVKDAGSEEDAEARDSDAEKAEARDSDAEKAMAPRTRKRKASAPTAAPSKRVLRKRSAPAAAPPKPTPHKKKATETAVPKPSTRKGKPKAPPKDST